MASPKGKAKDVGKRNKRIWRESQQKLVVRVPRRRVHSAVTGPLYTYNLELDCLAFEFNSTDLEIDPNSRNVTFCVGIVCKTEEEAGLRWMLVST